MSTFHDFLHHPIETLERALHIRKQIAALEEALKEVMGPTPPSLAGIQTTGPKRKGRRTMSAEAKTKIANAQKLRWAKTKAQKPPPGKPLVRAKRQISAAHRAKLVASAKARWANVKKGGSGKARQQIATAGQPQFKIF